MPFPLNSIVQVLVGTLTLQAKSDPRDRGNMFSSVKTFVIVVDRAGVDSSVSILRNVSVECRPEENKR